MNDHARLPFLELTPRGTRLHRAHPQRGPSVLVAGRGSQAPAALALLQREYALRATLHPDWAAVPEALQPSGEGVVLLLRDPGGRLLGEACRQPLAPAAFLRVARGLAAAVAGMHAAQIVHRALAPDCFLVDEATGAAAITGFGFAQRRGEVPPRGEESLAWDDARFDYMAPELGARMNVDVDARADLYALGCIFHELLTGAPPFDGPNAAARIHAHATRLPMPVHALRPEVPAQLSRIVLRLLQKSPDRRYAEASGLLADLRSCDELLRRHGTIPDFALDAGAALAAARDAGPVVGREDELERIATLYRAVADGQGARTAWVWGGAGLGKSALLREAVARMRLPVAPRVASGKCDAARSGVPFDALARALEPLLQGVLGSSDLEFEAWRDRLGQATAPVGATLAGWVPGLGAVLGLDEAPAVPAPGDTALIFEREIVLRAMARLFAAFARPEQPLVLLLDDLQWADVDTLRVLERLLIDFEDAPLLLAGSMRSSDAQSPHPLRASALCTRPGALHVDLQPLDGDAVRALIRQVLGQEADELGPLLTMVRDLTGHNPFFIRRLLARLVGKGLLGYDAASSRWAWFAERIAACPVIHDVGELLVRELDELPAATLALLRTLASLGDRAAPALLALAADQDERALAATLAEAIAAGFVALDRGDWTFTHDHVREAVHAGVPAAQRAARHLGIARRLRVAAASEDGRVAPFLVATQANQALSAVDTASERRAFALINLEAGKRAKAATAHHAALDFFGWALSWFGDEQTSPEALEASLLCGEAEFMTGALEAAEMRLSALQGLGGDASFGADVARLRVALYTTLGRFDLALDIGLAFLASAAAIDIPRHPTPAQVDAEYALLRAWLDEHGVAALRNWPIDADPRRRACVDIFADLLPPAMYSDQQLVDFMLLRMVRLAIAHGHCDASANGYVCLIQVLGARYFDFAGSRAFGELALHLVETRGLRRYRARVLHTYATFVVPWTQPARAAREYFVRAFDIATREGDHTFALYCGRNQATGMLFAGEFLEDVRQTVDGALARARDANFQLVVNAVLAQRSLLAALQDGEPRGDQRIEQMAEPIEGAPVTLVDLAYWVHRLQVGLLFGDLPEAIEARRRAEACVAVARKFAECGDLAFYGALALLQLRERDVAQDAALERHLFALGAWAAECPENFGARRDLANAELARVRGKPADAAELYAAAVAQARRHGFTQVEALAAELAASFHAGLGREIERRAYLRHALAAWQRWGAAAKARQLQQRHPELQDVEISGPASRLHELDVQAVLRITHALASDIVPERIVETTMRTALESAGADYGALALWRDGEWTVRARARMVGGQIAVTQDPAAFSGEVLPVSIAHAVARTQHAAQYDDAREAAALGQDEYVKRARPRSLLCVPMMRYARLIGVLYLENSLAPRVFTPAKAELLEVIASQAAFSLENTRLYEALVDQNRQRAEAEERLRAALAELGRASRLKAMGELVASIVHEIGQPLSSIDTSASAASRWLEREEPDIVEALAMVSHVRLSAKRAKSIIQGLRAMARKAEPQFADIDLCDALRECVSLVGGSMVELGVTLRVIGPARPCRVRGDRVQLQQVAINLLMNGAEAMVDTSVGQRLLTMRWGVARPDLIRVEIEDHGTGIAPDAAGQLTEPFFTTKSEGMGMGLAICKSIVDAHGGTLEFAPGSEGGTRVTLHLPSFGACGDGPEPPSAGEPSDEQALADA
ncbi:AAA family ATPase [Roseateles sp. So40a]|uniref:trifunctional serine/threonine-protein kinase/ATP-binding protein/sensor histidine kinase n=1 Tax=Roseateles sp. So40a TaxID=3400226 RepID=UPI003A8AD65E